MQQHLIPACDLATKWADTFKIAARIRASGVLAVGFRPFKDLKAGFSGSAPTLSKLLKSGVDAGLIEKDSPQYRLTKKYFSLHRITRGFVEFGNIYRASNILLRISQNAALLTALGDGEMCVGDIAKCTGWAGSKVSVRCARLYENGSLYRRRDDRRIYYAISPAGFRALERVMKAFEEA